MFLKWFGRTLVKKAEHKIWAIRLPKAVTDDGGYAKETLQKRVVKIDYGLLGNGGSREQKHVSVPLDHHQRFSNPLNNVMAI